MGDTKSSTAWGYFHRGILIRRNKYELRHNMMAAAETLVFQRKIRVVRMLLLLSGRD